MYKDLQKPFECTVQNADCRPLFSGLENNGTVVITFHLHGEEAVCSLHFLLTAS